MGATAGALATATKTELLFGQEPKPGDIGAPTTSTVEDRERRMQWWHAAKFGMFIHWGLYSTLGRHEWVMENEGITVREYERLAPNFKPVPNAARAGWGTKDLKPFVDQALEYFGPQRMMFGSDWPVCLLAASYDRVLDAAQSLLADLGDEDRNRIFSKKAAEFYGIQSQTALSCL